MKLRTPLVLAATVLLCACGGKDKSPTTPTPQPPPKPQPVLSATEAVPFTVVYVTGLPATHVAPGAGVRVGTTRVTLVHDTVGDRYAFMVPQIAPDSVNVTFTDAQGANPLSARLRVLAPVFVGGSAAAVVSRFKAQTDSALASLAYLDSRLDVEADTSTLAMTRALEQGLTAVQQKVDSLTPAQQAQWAAVYSAQSADMARITADFAAAVGAMQGGAPAFSRRPGPAAPALDGLPFGAESPAQFIAHCQQSMVLDEAISQLAEALDRLSIIYGLIGLDPLLAPVAEPIALVSGVLSGMATVYVGYLRSDAYLPVPNTLEFDVVPPTVRAGGRAGFYAQMRRISPGGAASSVASGAFGLFLTAFDAKFSVFERAASHFKGVVKFLVGHFGDAATERLVDEILVRGESLLQNHGVQTLRSTGTVTLALDGIEPAAAPNVWTLDPAGAGQIFRGFRVASATPDTSVRISWGGLGDTSGSFAACRIDQASAGDPAAGRNGFLVRAKQPAVLAWTAGPDSVGIHQNDYEDLGFEIANTGGATVRNVRIRLGTYQSGAFVPWSPPAGIDVSAEPWYDTLDPGDTVGADVVVSVSPAAPLQSFLVPLTLEGDSAKPVTRFLSLRVESQLADIVVNRANSSILFYDAGAQDGDSVRIELNGHVIAAAHYLLNAGTTFGVQYQPGRNVLRMTALNEGTLVPNTAAMVFSDVVSGPSDQSYDLETGQVVTLIIDLDTSRQSVSSARPAPRLSDTREQRARTLVQRQERKGRVRLRPHRLR
jgi:hypothetical protein